MPYLPDSRMGCGNHRPIDRHSPRPTFHEYWPTARGQASLDTACGTRPLQGRGDAPSATLRGCFARGLGGYAREGAVDSAYEKGPQRFVRKRRIAVAIVRLLAAPLSGEG